MGRRQYKFSSIMRKFLLSTNNHLQSIVVPDYNNNACKCNLNWESYWHATDSQLVRSYFLLSPLRNTSKLFQKNNLLRRKSRVILHKNSSWIHWSVVIGSSLHLRSSCLGSIPNQLCISTKVCIATSHRVSSLHLLCNTTIYTLLQYQRQDVWSPRYLWGLQTL